MMLLGLLLLSILVVLLKVAFGWGREYERTQAAAPKPMDDVTQDIINRAAAERAQRVQELRLEYLAAGFSEREAWFEADYRAKEEATARHYSNQRNLET